MVACMDLYTWAPRAADMQPEHILAHAMLLAGDKHLMRPEVTVGTMNSTEVSSDQIFIGPA